jgi:hypothetical protein
MDQGLRQSGIVGDKMPGGSVLRLDGSVDDHVFPSRCVSGTSIPLAGGRAPAIHTGGEIPKRQARSPDKYGPQQEKTVSSRAPGQCFLPLPSAYSVSAEEGAASSGVHDGEERDGASHQIFAASYMCSKYFSLSVV